MRRRTVYRCPARTTDTRSIISHSSSSTSLTVGHRDNVMVGSEREDSEVEKGGRGGASDEDEEAGDKDGVLREYKRKGTVNEKKR